MILIFVGFYSRNDSDIRQYHVHNAPVNCISFCSWDPLKCISTSHDGSVRCGDLTKRTFEVVSEMYNFLPIFIPMLINY